MVKQRKSYSGIFAIVKRKTSKKRHSLESSSASAEATSLKETESLSEAIDFAMEEAETAPTAVVAMESELMETSVQLQAAQSELEAAAYKIKQDEETMLSLQRELEEANAKLAKVEDITENLDDDSFQQAQEFQLKRKIDELQQELDKRSNLEQHVKHLKDEVQELQTLNQELRFQEERSSTRSKMKSLSEEKTTKEEVQRLQKELRQAEKNLKFETSHMEAQLKASQDANDRLQEKVKITKKVSDGIEKERLELKIENTRLLKKLEKSGSYAEKKRIQTEQETAELQLNNLKRKTVRLEQQLTASNQMLNMINAGGDVGDFSGVGSPAPRQTLSEARIIHLEKEVQQLEKRVAKLTKDNEGLEDKASSCEQTSEVFTLKVNQLDQQLLKEKTTVEKLQTELTQLRKFASSDSGEDNLAKLLKHIEDLETSTKAEETKFRVKEKDLWSTIEAQKKQIQDLEMDKLALELGDEEETSDAEERNATPKPEESELISLKEEVKNMTSENQKFKEDLERSVSSLELLQEEVQILKSENDSLKKELETSGDASTSTDEHLKEEIEQLKEKLETSEATSANSSAEIDSFQQEIASLKHQNEELAKELEDTRVKEDNDSFQQEIASLKNQNEDLAKELQEARDREEAVQASLKNQNEDLAKELEAARAKEAVGTEQLTLLQNQIESLKEENDQLEQDLSSKNSDTGSAEVISTLEKEIERLNTQTNELLEDLEGAERELDSRSASTAEIEKLRAENTKLRSDLENTEDELEKLDMELVEQKSVLQEKIKDLKGENAKLKVSE